MRWLLLLAVMFAVAGCGQDPEGERIDGRWLGAPADCAAMRAPELTCDRLIACALEHKWPDGAPLFRSAFVFDMPQRLRDGSLIDYGAGGSIVAFSLEDGSRVAQPVISTDGCPAT